MASFGGHSGDENKTCKKPARKAVYYSTPHYSTPQAGPRPKFDRGEHLLGCCSVLFSVLSVFVLSLLLGVLFLSKPNSCAPST